jgi:hypothetical protein
MITKYSTVQYCTVQLILQDEDKVPYLSSTPAFEERVRFLTDNTSSLSVPIYEQTRTVSHRAVINHQHHQHHQLLPASPPSTSATISLYLRTTHHEHHNHHSHHNHHEFPAFPCDIYRARRVLFPLATHSPPPLTIRSIWPRTPKVLATCLACDFFCCQSARSDI